MSYRSDYLEGLKASYEHRHSHRFSWTYDQDDDLTTTAHIVTALKNDGHTWKEIARVIDRPVRTTKLIYRNYREQGKQAHKQDTPGWLHDHERFFEYPPTRSLCATRN